MICPSLTLYILSSLSRMSFSFFVFYHPVSVTHNSGCRALIHDHSHVWLLPLSHWPYILVYSSLHILSIWASFSLYSLLFFYSYLLFSVDILLFYRSSSTTQCLKITIFTFQTFCRMFLSLFCMSPVSPFFSYSFLSLSCFMLFFASFFPLLYSSLLLNIWLWAHWHDTTVAGAEGV